MQSFAKAELRGPERPTLDIRHETKVEHRPPKTQ